MTAEQQDTLLEWLPYARGMARSFASRNTRVDADDLESAALMAVVEAIERYDGSTPFAGWCRITIKRRVLDCARRRIGRSGVERRGKSVAAMQLLHNDSNPNGCDRLNDYVLRDWGAVSLCELQPAEWIAHAAVGLRPRERKILRMRLEGHTLRECGQAVELTESRCSMLWGMIAAHLAEQLGRPERAQEVANCLSCKGKT